MATPCIDVRILQPCQRQYALALGGELIRGFHEMSAVERSHLAVHGLLTIAVIENDFRSAFNEQNLFASCRLVERRQDLCSDSNGMTSIRGDAVRSVARSMPSLLANG
jgi:hypothetical protein